MTTSADTQDEVQREYLKSVGIHSHHAYSVIGIYEVPVNEAIVRIIKIRNPWGNFEWNGDWSDYSPLWTFDLLKALDYTLKDDGIFCMAF